MLSTHRLPSWSLPLLVFATAQGVRGHRFPNGLFYAAPLWHPALLPPTFGIFAFVGRWVLWKRQRQGLILTAGWYATAYFFLVGMPRQNLRVAPADSERKAAP